MPGDSASYAAYMLAHIGVAAERRNLTRDQHRRHRRALEIHGVAVPDPAEVHGLVGQLRHRDDLGVSVDPLDERVLDRRHRCGAPKARNSSGPRDWSRKNTTRCSSHARRISAIVSSTEVGREIDAADLRAEGVGDRQDLDGAVLVVGRHRQIRLSSAGNGAQLSAEINFAHLARRGAREVVDDRNFSGHFCRARPIRSSSAVRSRELDRS